MLPENQAAVQSPEHLSTFRTGSPSTSWHVDHFSQTCNRRSASLFSSYPQEMLASPLACSETIRDANFAAYRNRILKRACHTILPWLPGVRTKAKGI